MSGTPNNSDAAELQKFAELAHGWWDPNGSSKPLHDLNPLRLDYIRRVAGLGPKNVADVGCGGGILSEAMAAAGATVLGIDLAPAVLDVARLHAAQAGVKVEYRDTSAEALAAQSPAAFDLVTCMEMLEHVPDPALTVSALAALMRPGADLIVSTLDRNWRSFLVAIVGAEYIARALPAGTHDYLKFIRPSELARWGRAAGLELRDLTGISYHPLTRSFSLSSDTSVNYLAHFRRAAR